MLRKDMEKHKKEECPRRQYECPHCKEAGEYKERTGVHLEECPKMKVPCPNYDCNEHNVVRCEISLHRQECMYEKVPCKYANIGCEEEVFRKDLKEHEDDSEQHLQLAIDTVRQQENLLAHLQSKLSELVSKVIALEQVPLGLKQLTQTCIKYMLTDFDHHKASNDQVYSPPFYTSPGGYKLCVRVDVNGYEDCKGTHISVYTFLMRGENDEHLPWPFTGTVTIKLLNQLEDKNHHCRDTTFPADNGAAQRVMSQERSSYGWGCRCYISHSALGFNAAEYWQYLMDDCLHFRIKVDAKNTFKPWLI